MTPQASMVAALLLFRGALALSSGDQVNVYVSPGRGLTVPSL